MVHTGVHLDAWLVDGLLHVRENSTECSLEQVGIYQVRGIPDEHLIFELVEDPCGASRYLEAEWINSEAR